MNTKTSFMHHSFILNCLLICRSEMASSSIDSLSPGSEGAGAISVKEVCEVLPFLRRKCTCCEQFLVL